MRDISSVLLRHGVVYSVERNNELYFTEKGLMNREQSTGLRYIGFNPGVPVEIGDWLINPSGDRFYVYDKETQSPFGDPYQLKCFIRTEAEHSSKQSPSNVTFNIGTATGSIIGTQSDFTLNYNSSIQQLRDQIANSESPDKAELEQLISLLEMVVNGQVPPQKGLFSKFASVLERNGWLAPQVASSILNWLTTHI